MRITATPFSLNCGLPALPIYPRPCFRLHYHLLKHRIVDLFVPATSAFPLHGPLDNHEIHGEIHAQSERGGRANHLNEAILEERLDEISILRGYG